MLNLKRLLSLSIWLSTARASGGMVSTGVSGLSLMGSSPELAAVSPEPVL
jgi:hypothetical protein